MESVTIDTAQLVEAVESLHREMVRLSQRMAALERLTPATANEATPSLEKATKTEGLTEELIMVISAAIAAYLGVKPHIRQIRLINNNPWGLQGRVTIQASHAFATLYG